MNYVYILLGIIIALVIIFGILFLIDETRENTKLSQQSQVIGSTSISFDTSYPLNSTATFTVVAPNYNSDPNLGHIPNGHASIMIKVKSTSDTSGGISLMLVQKDLNSDIFVTAPYKVVLTSLGTYDSIKWLHVSVNDTVTATYMGATTTAIITPPIPKQITHVGVAQTPSSVSFQYNNSTDTIAPQVSIDRTSVPSCVSNVLNDGICDDWVQAWWGGTPNELNIPYTNPTTGAFLVYTLNCNLSGGPDQFGANPDCPSQSEPNIYVEISYMSNPTNNPNCTYISGQNPSTIQQCHISQAPSLKALQSVVAAFARNGYDLHIQLNPDMDEAGSHIFFTQTIVPGNINDPQGTDSYFSLKNSYFGLDSERNPTNAQATANGYSSTTDFAHDTLSAKREVFHYGMFIHTQTGNQGSSGWGEILGNDFVVSMGSFTSDSTVPNGQGIDAQVEATLMHELGHNLNLNHGGPFNMNNSPPSLGPVVQDSSINCKPNYISPMNYLYQSQMMSSVSPNPITYSSNGGKLDEVGGLVESNGIGSPMSQNSVWWGWKGNIAGGPATSAASIPIDWDNEGRWNTVTGYSIRNAANYIADCNDQTPRTYSSYNDWNNLYLIFYNSINFATGESSNAELSHQDITSDEVYSVLKSIYCTPAGDYKHIAGMNFTALQGTQICTTHVGNIGGFQIGIVHGTGQFNSTGP